MVTLFITSVTKSQDPSSTVSSLETVRSEGTHPNDPLLALSGSSRPRKAELPTGDPTVDGINPAFPLMRNIP